MTQPMVTPVVLDEETMECGCGANCRCGSDCACCGDGDCAVHQPDDCEGV